MAHVAITGAAGNVGRVATEAFIEHELTLFTENEQEGMDSVVLDSPTGERFATRSRSETSTC